MQIDSWKLLRDSTRLRPYAFEKRKVETLTVLSETALVLSGTVLVLSGTVLVIENGSQPRCYWFNRQMNVLAG